jgi:hypothetical protein
MYDFAVVALLAVGTIKLVDFLVDLVPTERTFTALRSLLTFAAAVGAVWLLDYSMFEGWSLDIRNHATGVWMTALAVSGMTVPWRAAFRWLTHDSSTIDEPLGEHPGLRQVA